MKTTTSLNVDRSLAGLRTNGYSAKVKKLVPINDSLARVVVEIAASASPEDTMKAVASVSKNIYPVKGSFTKLSSNGIMQSLTGVVRAQIERVVVTQSNIDNFRAVAGESLYLDKEDSMWQMSRTEAGDIMIRANAADEREVLHGLMESVASASYEAVASSEEVILSDVHKATGADLIAYIDQKGVRNVGAVVADIQEEPTMLLAISSSTGESETIHRNQIVNYIESAEYESHAAEDAMVAAAHSLSRADIEDYYRRMFARSPAYFESFWERFTSCIYA